MVTVGRHFCHGMAVRSLSVILSYRGGQSQHLVSSVTPWQDSEGIYAWQYMDFCVALSRSAWYLGHITGVLGWRVCRSIAVRGISVTPVPSFAACEQFFVTSWLYYVSSSVTVWQFTAFRGPPW